MQYHSCDGNNEFVLGTSTARQSLCCQSVPLPQSSESVCEVCLSHSAITSPCVCSLSLAVAQGDVLQSHLKNCCHRKSALSDSQTLMPCANLKYSYSPFTQFSACCRRVAPHQFNRSQTKDDLDTRDGPFMPSSWATPVSEAEGVAGLKCRTNRTLRFYVLDVALNLPLAVRLGATRNRNNSLQREDSAQQQLEGSDGSFATIINLKDEVHYVLHRSPATTLTQSLGESRSNYNSFNPVDVPCDIA